MSCYIPKTLLVINKSTVVPNNKLAAYVLAVQQQVNEHFAPVWGISANLRIIQEEDLHRYPGAGAVYFLDEAPKGDEDMTGIMGYHEANAKGDPVAYVFAKTDIEYGLDPSVTFSHEVLEMLADVSTTWCTLVGNTLYCIEVCDAVEDDNDGYKINDVLVSNFVYPEWFDPRCRGKKLDHLGQCKEPLEIRPGGYMSIFEIGKDTQFRNIDGGHAKRLAMKLQTRPGMTRLAKRNLCLQCTK